MHIVSGTGGLFVHGHEQSRLRMKSATDCRSVQDALTPVVACACISGKEALTGIGSTPSAAPRLREKIVKDGERDERMTPGRKRTPGDFERELIQSAVPVLLTFRAEKHGADALDEVREEFTGRVAFLTVDVQDDDELLRSYGVVSLPTHLLVKDLFIRDVIVGQVPSSRLRSVIESAIA